MRPIFNALIFLTVASQSSTSIGFSPSVSITILRVQVVFFSKNWSWASIATISASIAVVECQCGK